MGKPPLTDEERRIKDLIRELHEAAKEGRQALKDLRAELNTLYREVIHEALQADLDTASDAIREGVASVDKHLVMLEERITRDYNEITRAGTAVQVGQREIMARLTGFQSKEESAKIFAAETARVCRALATDKIFAQLVASYVIDELDGETAGEFTGRAAANFKVMRNLEAELLARPGVTVRLADEQHPPGLYDEDMRPLDVRIVPLSVS